MSGKITVIADKDVGCVLAAVAESSVDGVLAVEQVVAASGLPMRTDTITVPFLVPRDELTTHLSSGDGPLFEPRSYVVVDGVVARSSPISTPTVTATKITITAPIFLDETKVKVIAREVGTTKTEVLTVNTIKAPNKDYAVTLRSGADYDLLILVEKSPALFQTFPNIAP